MRVQLRGVEDVLRGTDDAGYEDNDEDSICANDSGEHVERELQVCRTSILFICSTYLSATQRRRAEDSFRTSAVSASWIMLANASLSSRPLVWAF